MLLQLFIEIISDCPPYVSLSKILNGKQKQQQQMTNDDMNFWGN